MKPTYIYLNEETNINLRKLAQVKQLSLSLCVDIITKWLDSAVTYEQNQGRLIEYIDKGDKKVKLLVKSRQYLNKNDLFIHNCVMCYFYPKYLKDYPFQNALKDAIKHINREFDKTFDNNWLKNQIIRQTYRAFKSNKGKIA